MSIPNPVIANKLICPIDDTAAAPSVSFGGSLSPNGSSGTGIYGTETTMNHSIGGVSVLALTSSGISGSLTTSAALTAGTTVVAGTSVTAGTRFVLPAAVVIFEGAGIPTDGGAGTGLGFAGKGSLYIDATNANLYINANTSASPTWKLVTRAA